MSRATGIGGPWTNFVAQDTTAMEMPRAWTATALERRTVWPY